MKRLHDMEKAVDNEIRGNLSTGVENGLYEGAPPHINMLIDTHLFEITDREIPCLDAIIGMLRIAGFGNIFTMKIMSDVAIIDWWNNAQIGKDGVLYLTRFIEKQLRIIQR